MKTHRIIIAGIGIIILLIPNAFAASRLNEAFILKNLDMALSKMPDKIELLPEEIRRICIYSIKVDKKHISRSLFRQIQGKIEAKFTELKRPILVYAPEVKPVKLVVKDDTVSFVNELQTTEEVKEIAYKLKLDGLLEGSLALAGRSVYLNLRIVNTESMAVVWSQTFNSEEPEEKEIEKTTGADFGFGAAGMYLRETSTTDAALTLPEFAKYYYVNVRMAQRLSTRTRISIALTGKLYYLYDGFKATRATVVSSTSGQGTFSLGTYFGVRFPIVPVAVEKGKRKRDWIASEIKFGRIWGSRAFQTNVYGFQIESDITRNLTVALGISYTKTEKITYSSGEQVKAGGLLYEISILQFNYKP